MEVAQEILAVGASLDYSIVNTGNVRLIYGLEVAIEWRQGRRWIALPFGCWFAAVGKGLEPGQRSAVETYDLTQHLAPGRYRLAKKLSSMDVLPSKDSIEVRCEFSIDFVWTP